MISNSWWLCIVGIISLENNIPQHKMEHKHDSELPSSQLKEARASDHINVPCGVRTTLAQELPGKTTAVSPEGGLGMCRPLLFVP